MIEFNLLPDVKLDYLKSEHTKHMVLTISVLIGGISLAVLLLLFSAMQLQNHQINSNKNQIKQLSSQLTGTTDINKVLTIQNQLKTVVSLHNQAPVVTRLYDYLPQLVPQSVTIGQLTIDFPSNTLRISGQAPSLETINTFADTLKFAKYTVDDSNKKSAFPTVVLDAFSRQQNTSSYSFSISFDPVLFDGTKNVKLAVPSDYVSTRSFTELPSNDLFKTAPSPTNQKAQ